MAVQAPDCITFHNGEPFDAEAVKYSIERIYDPALNAPAFLKGFVSFDRIEIVDPTTVNISDQDSRLADARLAGLNVVRPRAETLPNAHTARYRWRLQAVGPAEDVFKEWVRDDLIPR